MMKTDAELSVIAETELKYYTASRYSHKYYKVLYEKTLEIKKLTLEYEELNDECKPINIDNIPKLLETKAKRENLHNLIKEKQFHLNQHLESRAPITNDANEEIYVAFDPNNNVIFTNELPKGREPSQFPDFLPQSSSSASADIESTPPDDDIDEIYAWSKGIFDQVMNISLNPAIGVEDDVGPKLEKEKSKNSIDDSSEEDDVITESKKEEMKQTLTFFEGEDHDDDLYSFAPINLGVFDISGQKKTKDTSGPVTVPTTVPKKIPAKKKKSPASLQPKVVDSNGSGSRSPPFRPPSYSKPKAVETKPDACAETVGGGEYSDADELKGVIEVMEQELFDSGDKTMTRTRERATKQVDKRASYSSLSSRSSRSSLSSLSNVDFSFDDLGSNSAFNRNSASRQSATSLRSNHSLHSLSSMNANRPLPTPSATPSPAGSPTPSPRPLPAPRPAATFNKNRNTSESMRRSKSNADVHTTNSNSNNNNNIDIQPSPKSKLVKKNSLTSLANLGTKASVNKSEKPKPPPQSTKPNKSKSQTSVHRISFEDESNNNNNNNNNNSATNPAKKISFEGDAVDNNNNNNNNNNNIVQEDLTKLRLSELKIRAKIMGVPVNGRKQDIIERINNKKRKMNLI